MVEETKPWYLSRGVMGALMVVVSGGFAMAGIDFDKELQDQAAGLVIALGTLVGGVLSFIGRLRAKARIV